MSHYKYYIHSGRRQVGQNGTKFFVGLAIIYICLKYIWTTPISTDSNLAVQIINEKSSSLIVTKEFDAGCPWRPDQKISINCFNGVRSVRQDDPLLVQIVRNHFLYPPPPKEEFDLLALIKDANYPSDRNDPVAPILKNLSPGFFIECGALDGLFASNTLWLERKLKWTGLLIEANQNDFQFLASRQRKAWTSNVCLSNRPWPDKINFYLAPPPQKGGKPGVAGLISREGSNTIPVKVQCIPLYTLLVALNRTIVDYFSLDVEGAELDILKTVPFDKVIFKVLTIENAYIPGGHEALNKFLEGKGYVFYKFAPDPEHPWDSIFLHSSISLAEDLSQLRLNNSGKNST